MTIRYKADRPAIAALALTTDTSALTAAGLDRAQGGVVAMADRQILGQFGVIGKGLGVQPGRMQAQALEGTDLGQADPLGVVLGPIGPTLQRGKAGFREQQRALARDAEEGRRALGLSATNEESQARARRAAYRALELVGEAQDPLQLRRSMPKRR